MCMATDIPSSAVDRMRRMGWYTDVDLMLLDLAVEPDCVWTWMSKESMVARCYVGRSVFSVEFCSVGVFSSAVVYAMCHT